MTDSHKNFAKSNVATAPSPATSGTSLVVTAAQGALFPTPPFNATVWPTGQAPTASNAEIVRVTGISTDTLTIQRAQEGSSARTIVIGDNIANTITVKVLTDIETGPALAPYSLAASPPSSGTDGQLVVFTDQGVQQWESGILQPIGPQQSNYDTLSSQVTALGSPISPSVASAIVATNSGGTAFVATGLLVDANVDAAAAIAKTKISGTAVTLADSATVTAAMLTQGAAMRVIVIGYSGSTTGASMTDTADFYGIAPANMTITKIKVTAKTGPAGAMTVRPRRSTANNPASFSDLFPSGLVVEAAFSATRNSAVATATTPVAVNEGDLFNFSLGTATGAANILVQLVGYVT